MKSFCLTLFFIFLLHYSFSQKITYGTEGDVNTTKSEFNIIGKIEDKYFVHIGRLNNSSPVAGNYNNSLIYVYDRNMKLLSHEKMNLPAEYSGIHFLAYPSFAYMFYQYTKENKTYCMALKIDSNGKQNGNPIKLAETIRRDFYENSPIYNIIFSEDKSITAIFTMGEYEQIHVLTVFVLNKDLKRTDEKKFEMPRTSFHERFTEFNIDNKGNFVFLRTNDFDNTDPHKYIINFSPRDSSALLLYNASPAGIRLNFPTLKIDNANNRFMLFSFYTDSSLKVLLNDIELSKAKEKAGIFKMIFNLKNLNDANAEILPFDAILKNYPENSDLNSLLVQNFSFGNFYKKGNHGFLLEGIGFPTPSNRYRFNYQLWEAEASLEREYISYNNFNWGIPQKITVSFESNNLFFLFDSTGTMNSFDYYDNLDIKGTMTMNGGDGIHYFILHEDRNNYSINHLLLKGSGELIMVSPIKGIGNYTLMSNGSMQVSQSELIFPVLYNGKLNFAKLEL